MISLLCLLVKWVIQIVVFIITLPFRVIKGVFNWLKTGNVHNE